MNRIMQCIEAEAAETAIVNAENLADQCWNWVQDLQWEKQCELRRPANTGRRMSAINDDLRRAWDAHRRARAALKQLRCEG